MKGGNVERKGCGRKGRERKYLSEKPETRVLRTIRTNKVTKADRKIIKGGRELLRG